jgi:hypothetical protein
MRINEHPKLNSVASYSRPAISSSLDANITHPDFLPARRIMICLGWLRLYQTILPHRSRTRHAKILAH